MTTTWAWILCAAIVGAVGAAAVPANGADAGPAARVCKFHFSTDRDLPASVLQMMKSHRDQASFTCVEQGNAIMYDSVTAIRVGSHNVCAFTKFTRLFLSGEKAPFGWPGETYMIVGQPACPRQDDERYIGVGGLSDGLFALLVQFAEDIRRSEQAFDAAFAPEKPQTERERELYAQMRRILLDRTSPIQIVLHGIEPDIPLTSDTQSYALSFWERPFCGNMWTLYVDLTAAGWKVIAFDGLTYTSHFDPAPICP